MVAVHTIWPVSPGASNREEVVSVADNWRKYLTETQGPEGGPERRRDLGGHAVLVPVLHLSPGVRAEDSRRALENCPQCSGWPQHHHFTHKLLQHVGSASVRAQNPNPFPQGPQVLTHSHSASRALCVIPSLYEWQGRGCQIFWAGGRTCLINHEKLTVQ